jgi:putative DNA primase/helicase
VLAPGIEVKGEGGYIVVPPSVMTDGKAYTSNDAAICDAPIWLSARIADYYRFEEEIDRDAAANKASKAPIDLDEERAALDAIPSDDYWVWLKVLGALQCDIGGETGCTLFVDWSRKSEKFNEKVCLRKWAKANIRQFHVATIFHFANNADKAWQTRYKQTRNESYGPGSAEDGGHHARQDDWELVSVLMSTIKAKKIIWLWKWRIACGKLTVFAGMPDTNKSTAALDLAARVTVGGPLPAGEGQAPLGNIIIFSAEDDAADTLRPRLEVAGADLDRIHYVSMVKEKKGGHKRGFDLTQDIERLETKIIEIGNVVMVIIDPVSAYLGKPGKLDSYRQTDVRGTLSPLEEMVARHQVAVVGIDHLNKKSGLKALLRVGGSIAFTAAPRSVIIFVRDEEDLERRLFLPAKNNNAPEEYKTGLAFRIVKRFAPPPVFDVMPAVEWETEPVNVTADEALEADGKKTDGRRSDTAEVCKVFLQEFLRAGPRMVKDIEAEAKKRGLNPSSKSIRTAKEGLKIISRRKGTEGWEWTLPGQQGDFADVL